VTRSEYLESQKNKQRQESTVVGKQAVKYFVKAINIRLKAESKSDGVNRQDIDDKYGYCAFFFFKWLAEIKEFDKLNTPIFNVPIITIWRRWDGKIQICQNMIGSNFYVTNIAIYQRFKNILKWTLKKLRRNAYLAKKQIINYRRKYFRYILQLDKLQKKEVLAMKLRKLERKDNKHL